MASRKKKKSFAPGGVRVQLESSAGHSESEAIGALRSAIDAMKANEDVDRVLQHISDATMHLGEARGYRNAIVDLLEDG